MMNVLVVDVGGTNVKILATGQESARKFPSGPALTFLHAEDADGRLPGGARRAATLEDVFVRLTGDYVE